jgi:hypothetical protein
MALRANLTKIEGPYWSLEAGGVMEGKGDIQKEKPAHLYFNWSQMCKAAAQEVLSMAWPVPSHVYDACTYIEHCCLNIINKVSKRVSKGGLDLLTVKGEQLKSSQLLIVAIIGRCWHWQESQDAQDGSQEQIELIKVHKGVTEAFKAATNRRELDMERGKDGSIVGN